MVLKEKMSEDLLKCPFCGGKARLTYDTYGSRYVYYVQCDSVSCSIKPVTWIYTTGEKAVEAWNKMVYSEYAESMYTRKEYGE